MAGDGLFDPLGLDRAQPSRPALKLSAPLVVLGAAALGLATIVAIASMRDDGDRGTPRAISSIEHVLAPARPVPPAPLASPPPPPVAPAAVAAMPPGLPAVGADQDVEIQNGVRVIRPKRDRRPADGQSVQLPGAPPTGPAAHP